MMKSTGELKKNSSFLQELWQFLAERKKWYLIPIAVGILLMGVLLILGSTAAAPFIYSLF